MARHDDSPPKIPLVPTGKSILEARPSRAHQEGRTRRHERGARDAMAANWIARRAMQFADGEVVWSWRLDAGAKLATMLRIALAMVTRKPDHREERGVSRKAIAQGMPECCG